MATLAEQLETTKNINEQLLASKLNPRQTISALPDFATTFRERPGKQSALGVLDRARYGFADDWGKRQIIQQAGYSQDQIVRLQNGEYGVKIPGVGVKPIDPKGFQFSDMAGDVSESLGKMIPTIGAVVGSSGGILGTATGASSGEALRQVMGEKMLKVRRSGLQSEDVLEMAGEGVMAGIGYGIAQGISSKLAQIGSRKAVQSGELTVNQLLNKKFNPTVIGKADRYFGINNEYLTKDMLAGKIGIIDGTQADDAIKSGVKQIVQLVENGQQKANEAYAQKLISAYGDDFGEKIVYSTSKLKDNLATSITSLAKNDVTKMNASQINSLKNVLDSITGQDAITFNQMKNITTSLNDLRASTYINGRPTGMTRNVGKIQAEFLKLKDTNVAVREADKAFSKDIGLINGLQKNAGIRLQAGELAEGIRSPEKLIMRLKDEMSERRLVKLDKIQDMLNQSGIKTDFMTEIKTGLLTDILDKKSIIPPTGWSGTPIGMISTLVKKGGMSPINQAKAFVGSLRLSPDVGAEQVGKNLGMVQSLATLVGQKTGVSKITRPTKKFTAKAVSQITNNKKAQALAANILTRQVPKSLNSILYGEQ